MNLSKVEVAIILSLFPEITLQNVLNNNFTQEDMEILNDKLQFILNNTTSNEANRSVVNIILSFVKDIITNDITSM